MRQLSVLILSLVLCLFGVLFVAFPDMWLTSQPWQSPLVWGGAVVFSAWMYCVRAVGGGHMQTSGALVVERRRGAVVIMGAAVMTYSLMEVLVF